MSQLIPIDAQQLAHQAPALSGAIASWANATTSQTSPRRDDLIRDKVQAVGSFFAWAGKSPDKVTAIDVRGWQAELESQGKAPATVYSRISRISSFYTWALKSPELAERLRYNPVTLARPKAPKPYQSESVKALDDDQARALLQLVKAKAETGDLVGLRDYALLLFFLLTGLRRTEVISLRWGDVKQHEDGLIITVRLKGGEIINREITEPAVKAALLDYLKSSGRLDAMEPSSPLWTRHDRAGGPGAPLTSHAFAFNLKRYARQAGLGEIHLHQTRHTYARMVAEQSGSLITTQDELGHKNLATTRVYVQRIGLKRDRFSGVVADLLGLGEE